MLDCVDIRPKGDSLKYEYNEPAITNILAELLVLLLSTGAAKTPRCRFPPRADLTMNGKTYLGHGVYCDLDMGMVRLTTENAIETTNAIHLEPEVVAALFEIHAQSNILANRFSAAALFPIASKHTEENIVASVSCPKCGAPRGKQRPVNTKSRQATSGMIVHTERRELRQKHQG